MKEIILFIISGIQLGFGMIFTHLLVEDLINNICLSTLIWFFLSYFFLGRWVSDPVYKAWRELLFKK